MRNLGHRIFFVACSFVTFTLTSYSRPALASFTLKDSYEAAIEKTESVKAQQSRVEQAQARDTQAHSAVIPHFYLNGAYGRADGNASSTTTTGSSTGGAAGSPSFSLGNSSESYTVRLNAVQPLFHGFREFAGIEASNADVASNKYLTEAARLSLYDLVAQAFYSVLAAEKDLANLQAQLTLTTDRIKELTARTRVGRSRQTELLAAESQRAALRAQIMIADGALAQAREQFAFATGLPADSLLQDNAAPVPQQLATLTEFTNNLNDRPDLRSFLEQEKFADAQVKVAKSNYWPSLDFNGNYYFRRTGAAEGSKWDASLSLTIPLFEGFVTEGQVREAAAHLYERKLLTLQADRTALRDVDAAYKFAQSGIEQIRLLKEALDLAEKTYREENRDYRFGLSTNLDVLTALNALQDTRRTFDRTYYQTQIALINLQVAQGKMP